MENYNFREIMNQKNRYTTNSNINNPLPNSEFYISENDRLFGDNFATGEYLRRKQENEKKKEKYKYRQNQLFERERKRWERLDYEYLRRENQNMMNKERNLVGRKNNPGMAFNPLNLQYDNSVQGEILKRRDEESKYRAWLRSVNIDKHSNTGYNIINGEERTILEERLNKDIVPDLIQKNIDQINEMKNKVVFNYNNFYTRCNPSSPDLSSYRYDNNNNYNENRVNRSTNTPNILNNNGGRFRAPVDLREERKSYDNGVTRSNNILRGNNILNNYNNDDYNNIRNNFSPQPRSPNINTINNINVNNDNMNNNNYYNNNGMNNDMINNINNNNMNNNLYNNNRNDMMNNNDNQYNDRKKNVTPNVGIIDLNNMDSNNNQNERTNNNYPENNNTLNNNYRNNNMNNQNMSDNNRNNINKTPNNNNFIENGNNIMGGKNDFYYKGNQNDVNSNLDQRENGQNDYQGQPQSNYGVNPYNPYSRPDFYMMSK